MLNEILHYIKLRLKWSYTRNKSCPHVYSCVPKLENRRQINFLYLLKTSRNLVVWYLIKGGGQRKGEDRKWVNKFSIDFLVLGRRIKQVGSRFFFPHFVVPQNILWTTLNCSYKVFRVITKCPELNWTWIFSLYMEQGQMASMFMLELTIFILVRMSQAYHIQVQEMEWEFEHPIVILEW